MKRISLITLASFFIASVAHAQINKGTILLGGNLSFHKNKTKYSSFTSSEPSILNLNPSAGFVVKDNKVIGANLTYGHSRNRYDRYGAGVFYRSYLTLGKNFYLFGQINTGYNHYKLVSLAGFDSKEVSRTNSIGVDLFPGIAFAASKRFHLEVSMNNLVGLDFYQTVRETTSSSGTSEHKTKGLDFGANINPESNFKLGFRFVLGK